MTDNLFDRLADLFRSPGPVNWRLAREIAESSAGTAEPIEPWLDEEYRDLAATAARYVDAASRLDAAVAGGSVRVLDRRGWASRQPEAFAYFAEPLAGKFAAGGGPMPDLLAPLGPAMVGLQIGGMVGAMSTRVLAGFDVGLPSGEAQPATFVVPNVEQFATEHALDPRQVRLWAATQEITHVAAMAIPWIHEQAVMRVATFVDTLEIDPGDLGERLAALQDPETLREMLGEGTVPGMLAGAGRTEALDEVRALMSVVEGYADFLVDTVLGGLLPQVARLRTAIDRSRAEPSEGERLLGQMIGLDLQRGRYRLGATFCAEVDRRWGADAVDRIWESPESLPTARDLDDPVGWAARVLL